MSTVSQIIRMALRETNIIASFEVIPSAQEAELKAKLYRLLKSTFSEVVGYLLKDWQFVASAKGVSVTNATGFQENPPSIWTIPPNARVLCGLTNPAEIQLNPYPQDGERFEIVGTFANPLTISSSNYITIEQSTAVVIDSKKLVRYDYFYRSDIMNWVKIPDDYANGNEDFLFPDEFDNYFVSSLALKIGTMYGRDLPQVLIDSMQEGKNAIKLRYNQGKIDNTKKLEALN